MKKMRLDPLVLRVESFDPVPARAGRRGTVHGFESAYWEMCDPNTTTVDPRVDTCGCTANTCLQTCNRPTCYQCGGASGGCPVVSVDPQACMQEPIGP